MNILIDEEFKSLIPPLSAEERTGLEESIKNEGCRDAIVLWNGTIIDGHNRYEICTQNGIGFETIEMEFESKDDAKAWIIRNQFSRRNILTATRCILAGRLEEIVAKQNKEKQAIAGTKHIGNQYTNKEMEVRQPVAELPKEEQRDYKTEDANKTAEIVAKSAGVSRETYRQFKQVQEKASEQVKQSVLSGETSIKEAYTKLKKEEKQKEREQMIAEQEQAIENEEIQKPSGKFDVIAIDPPWNYGTKYSANGRRVANPYPEMNQDELKALEIPSKDDCVMFLWTTQKFIWDAKELLEYWGFEYRAMIVWDKETIGMGDLLRMQCEFCLVGIKGKPIFKNNHSTRDIIREPKREHSRKPESFYKLVEDLCIGKKLDFFSRESRKGWEAYGNDTKKF